VGEYSTPCLPCCEERDHEHSSSTNGSTNGRRILQEQVPEQKDNQKLILDSFTVKQKRALGYLPTLVSPIVGILDILMDEGKLELASAANGVQGCFMFTLQNWTEFDKYKWLGENSTGMLRKSALAALAPSPTGPTPSPTRPTPSPTDRLLLQLGSWVAAFLRSISNAYDLPQ
jgi:hypothetical protein